MTGGVQTGWIFDTMGEVLDAPADSAADWSVEDIDFLYEPGQEMVKSTRLYQESMQGDAEAQDDDDVSDEMEDKILAITGDGVFVEQSKEKVLADLGMTEDQFEAKYSLDDGESGGDVNMEELGLPADAELVEIVDDQVLVFE